MTPNPLRSVAAMSRRRKIVTGLGTVAVAGAVTFGGVSLASADETASTGRSADVAVTGAEATKVSAVVTAKDSAVTVTEVRKDPDGSYDVLGTKAGADVFYDVSADLTTATAHTGHGHGHGRGDGDGGRGGSADTPVTGAEATKVSAVVTAKDSAVTVTEVRKDPDGSYDVLGTKAGADVFYDVSADLTTATLNDRSGRPHGSDDADGSDTAGAA